MGNFIPLSLGNAYADRGMILLSALNKMVQIIPVPRMGLSLMTRIMLRIVYNHLALFNHIHFRRADDGWLFKNKTPTCQKNPNFMLIISIIICRAGDFTMS